MEDIYEMPAIRTLKACASSRYNMRALLRRLRQNHDKSYNILEELKNAGFIKFIDQKNTRGRTSKIVVPTQLGIEFLDFNLRNQLKRIHLTDDDIRKAIHLASFTQSLVELGVNPYDRLVEMNEIAFSIRSTPQDNKNT